MQGQKFTYHYAQAAVGQPLFFSEEALQKMVKPPKKMVNAYTYGFNGMEKDDQVKGKGNSYDFGARMYDGRLGRWWSVDPLRSMYPSIAPYAFAGNSPIKFKDPDGRIIVDANGNIIYSSTGKIEPPPEIKLGEVVEYDKIEHVKVYANDGTSIDALKITRVRMYHEYVERVNADGTTYLEPKIREDIISSSHNSSYNCHGYTFVKGNLWIESPEIDKLLEHDGYYKQGIITAEDAVLGDICMYCNENYDHNNQDLNYNYSHSGVLSADGNVKSKFGRNDLKETTNQEVEDKYGARTEIYKKIPDKILPKDQLKPGKSSDGTRELKSKETNKLQDSGVIKH